MAPKPESSKGRARMVCGCLTDFMAKLSWGWLRICGMSASFGIHVQELTCTDTSQPGLSILAPDAVQEVLALPGSCPTEHKS